tara:strand:- start:196 stop:465 length:270 start_codon:yes stop_codon:yes gene_type:complete
MGLFQSMPQLASHPLVQAMHPFVTEVNWDSNNDEWWAAAKTESYDLTVGPWSMVGKATLDLDRLIWHQMMYALGIEDKPCYENGGDKCE